MRPLRPVLAATLLSLVAGAGLAPPASALGGKGKPNAFVPEEVATPEAVRANARKYWKAQGLGRIKEAGFRTVAITEFNVEYVTSETSDWGGRGGFGLLDVAQMSSGAGRKKFEFSEDFKTSLPRRLHDRFVVQLQEAGYEVKPLEEVAGSPAFARFRGHDEPDKGKRSGKYTTERTQVYPVEGLVDVRTGAFAAMGNAKAEAQLLHELGVDVGLKVQVKVGIWKGTMPAIERDSVVTVSAGVREASGPGGSPTYWVERTGTVTSKDGFYLDTEVTQKGGRKGTYKVKDVDEPAFEQALMEMFPPYMAMAVAMIDQTE